MEDCEESNIGFVYDPVHFSIEGMLFDRIFLEELWDQSINGPAYNREI